NRGSVDPANVDPANGELANGELANSEASKRRTVEPVKRRTGPVNAARGFVALLTAPGRPWQCLLCRLVAGIISANSHAEPVQPVQERNVRYLRDSGRGSGPGSGADAPDDVRTGAPRAERGR